MENIQQFAQIIKNSKKIVFFGGAGVSTESGLKDYRSKDGIYNTCKKYGIPPEEIISIDYFYENPAVFYDFYREYFISNAAPNAAHTAIAQLEKLGKDVTVVTQNVDGLHQKAGSKNVVELHGSASVYYCEKCGANHTTDYVADTSRPVPYCTKCGGVVRPHVTLYGEGLDNFVVEKAIRSMWEADTLIIGGTSLTVYPASGFIDYFRGDNIVIINKQPTHGDGRADLVFRQGIGSVMSQLIEILQEK
ncbi:MAG: NAD-dependent protein deacylase [Oscillospiraceae bacterium]|nr:NAD-dependent protein deacylase [Oscillospiraceae bacterium]